MALPEDLFEEFLLRLPPSEPASLVRAALICKPWRRLISSPRFRRRFHDFHRTPPMLGFICNTRKGFAPYMARFIPTSFFRSPRADHHDWFAVDARHGYVLLSCVKSGLRLFVVWNPMTDEWWQLPLLLEQFGWTATVLCGTSSASDHLYCLHRTFLVVLMSTARSTDLMHMTLMVYSSESGPWSEQTVVPRCKVDEVPTILVGNTIYFSIDSSSRILCYDLATKETCVIDLPDSIGYTNDIIMMEDAGLGVSIATWGNKHTLSLWSLETTLSGDVGWAQIRIIDLKKLFHGKALSMYYTPVGSAPGILIFTTDDGLFSINLESDQVKKELDNDGNTILNVIPYMSFYTPGTIVFLANFKKYGIICLH